MSNNSVKPVAAAIGAAFAGSMLLTGAAGAASNPFGLAELNGGYAQIASSHEGKCGAGKCGGANAAATTEKAAEGKCGAGKCGGASATATTAKAAEGKCGAGKCGGANATVEKAAEGKCGAGKCGAGK